MLTVAAGLIVEGDRILLGQRSPFGSHPFKWEFPGGKVEAGETIEEALRRELREELEITAHHIEEVHRYEFAYPGKKPIELVFLRVNGYSGQIHNRVFHALSWTDWRNLKQYDILDGDLPFLEWLEARGGLGKAGQA